jgi:hypothetical protein
MPDRCAVRQVLKCGRTMHPLLAAVSLIPPGAPPGRYWLEAISFLVPSPGASRGLLLADTAVILLAAAGHRRPALAAAAGLGAGFLALNLVGMLLTDFFLGLAAFHVLVGAVALGGARPVRWAGAGLLGLTLALGVLT